MTCAVELRDVSKAFVVKRNAASNLKVKLLGLYNERYRERREQFWAVRGVDLMVRQGEFVGLIGPNGSGKSTLLRLMAGIFPPSRGTVIVRGRVAPMIELGVGFHPDLTGRENLYLNTSLYRLSKRETDLIYRQVVEFSGVEEFMDMPVKNYSAGMYARLGFAIAVHLEADVLLVDEVLAVGDEAFQQKCLLRMTEAHKQGKTVIVVSHDMGVIEKMCVRACLVVRGRLEADGEPAKVIHRYRDVLSSLR